MRIHSPLLPLVVTALAPLAAHAATESAAHLALTTAAVANPLPHRSIAALTASLPAQPGDTSSDAPAATEDKSGTDPTKFLRTLGLRNEYQRLTNDKSFNLTTLTYIQPFADGRMNVRLKAPLAYTDATGDDEFGLSDISLRYNWLAHVDASQGILLSADLTADTASEDALGRGKWYIAPGLTYAMFLSPTMIFAPAY